MTSNTNCGVHAKFVLIQEGNNYVLSRVLLLLFRVSEWQT